MPLPADNVAWPPPHCARRQQGAYSALYGGLAEDETPGTVRLRPDVAGQKPGRQDSPHSREVKSTLAATMASVTADLLFGEAYRPGLTVAVADPSNPLTDPEQAAAATAALGTIFEAGLWTELTAAAELASPLGDAYLRLIADPSVAPHPIVEAVPATMVHPEWRYKRLVAATLWTELGTTREGGVLRWVERRDNQARTIEHGLYAGTRNNLGKRLDLTDHTATASLPPVQDYPAGVDAMVWHVPNMLPSRRWPESGHGRSDLEGVESHVAAHTLVYTSGARDFRTGKARIIASVEALRKTEYGSVWDGAAELLVGLGLDPEGNGPAPTMHQPAIRVSEHVDGARWLAETVVTTAGYSPATFGLGPAFGQAESGTALKIREQDTLNTIGRKRTLWTPVLVSVARNSLALYAAAFGQQVPPVAPAVTWPDLVGTDPLQQAQRLSLLVTAGVMSIEQAVREQHPEWTPDEWAAEVDRLRAAAPPAPDVPAL